jgi:hypothetical protein
MKKYKKQFRLYDVYRCATTGQESNIYGIHKSGVSSDGMTVSVRYTEKDAPVCYFADNEKELKGVVREINKRLNNCHKPGRKSRQNGSYKQMRFKL